MNTKQIITTAVVTLAVTIISGIIVNWYTKNQIEKKTENEALVYNLLSSNEFKTDSFNVSLVSLEIQNQGSNVAEEVKTKIIFSESSKIIDGSAFNERTNETYKATNKDNNSVTFSWHQLFSKEKITISIALKEANGSPDIILQSSKTVGVPVQSLISKSGSEYSQGVIIVALSVLILFFVYLFTKTSPFARKYSKNLNNNAFLFLHNNQFLYAEELLNNEIKKNGGTSHELANLALAKYMQHGNNQDSNSLLRMSDFLSVTDHEKAVMHFNKGIICGCNKDYLKAQENFEKAIKLNPKEIKKYFNYSFIMKDIRSNDPQVDILITNILKRNKF